MQEGGPAQPGEPRRGALYPALKNLIVKEMRARVTAVDNVLEPAPVLALKNQGVGDSTKSAWVITRACPQESVGDNTCLSTGVGDSTIPFPGRFSPHHGMPKPCRLVRTSA